MVPYLIIAAVALQRLIEVGYARRNTRALLMRGGIEAGRRHYPLFVLLHAAWLLAILVALPEPPVIHAAPLVIFILLQAARLWVIASLGPYWTTRIITLPGEAAAGLRRGLGRADLLGAERDAAGVAHPCRGGRLAREDDAADLPAFRPLQAPSTARAGGRRKERVLGATHFGPGA